MSKDKKDLSEKIEKKLKEIKFKSPAQSKDPKIVQKKLKEVFKKKPEEKKKKESFNKKDILKKVSKILQKNNF